MTSRIRLRERISSTLSGPRRRWIAPALALAAPSAGRRSCRWSAALALTVAGACATPSIAATRFSAPPRVRDAGASVRTLRVKDRAHLHLLSANGNTLVETGHATGNLPGTVKVSLTLHSHAATSSFTLEVRGGSISGHGSGTLKTGKSGWDSFGGKLFVSHGSGRFSHAHGRGGLYGAVYRVTDSMNVQVYGTLHY